MTMPIVVLPHDVEWTPSTWRELKMSDGLSATVTCPNGHTASLLDHVIAPDGNVSPSLICPQCDFHAFVVLQGWNGG